MGKVVVSTLVSLDGVIQDPGGFGETPQGGWGGEYFDEEAQAGALELLADSDYFLCGRVTFELLRRAWAGVDGGPYLQRMAKIPKLVASTTLRGSLDWNASVIEGDVAAEIARLKQQPDSDIAMYGSASLMQTLMMHNLIDEYRVWIHPLVLGSGTRLFSENGATPALRLTGSKALRTGVLIATYVPAG